MTETLTTKEAAGRLGVTPARIRQMVLAGQLPAAKFGRDLVIKANDLALVAERPVGRPPKPTAEQARRLDGKVKVKLAGKKSSKR